jgi:hypothetical protein
MACSIIEVSGACLGVDRKQLIDTRYDAHRHSIARMKFHRLKKLSASMGPTPGVHHLRAAHLFIGSIAVALQYPFELSQEPLGPFTPAAQAEVKHYISSRSAVLP